MTYFDGDLMDSRRNDDPGNANDVAFHLVANLGTVDVQSFGANGQFLGNVHVL
jgi:hypothetical protein